MDKKCLAISDLINGIGSDGINTYIEFNSLKIKTTKKINSQKSIPLLKNLLTAFGENSSSVIIQINSSFIESKTEIQSYLNNTGLLTIELEISTAADDNIFLDIEHFKKKWIGTQKWPECFYLFDRFKLFNDTEILDEDIKKLKKTTNFIEDVLYSIKELSHHQSKDGGAIFIDTKENSTPSIEISTDINNIFSDNEYILDEIPLYNNFLSSIVSETKNNSFSSFKELAVLRNSIFEFFKKNNDKNNINTTTIYLLKNFQKLHDIFSRNYQVFVNGLSLEKIRAELISEQTKFTEQATKNLMDTTNKMFALPGVTLLSKFLSSENNIVSAKIIDFGIIITCFILILVLIVQIYQINTLEESKSVIFYDFNEKLKGIDSMPAVKDLEKILSRVSCIISLVGSILAFYLIISISVCLFFLIN